MITNDIGCGGKGRESDPCRGKMLAGGKRKRSTPQSDTTIISIAGERGAVRER